MVEILDKDLICLLCMYLFIFTYHEQAHMLRKLDYKLLINLVN